MNAGLLRTVIRLIIFQITEYIELGVRLDYTMSRPIILQLVRTSESL